MSEAISIRHVSYRFGDHLAVDDLSLTIHPGEELTGVLQRIFQDTNAGGQVRVVDELSNTIQGRFQFRLYCLEIQLIKGLGQL